LVLSAHVSDLIDDLAHCKELDSDSRYANRLRVVDVLDHSHRGERFADFVDRDHVLLVEFGGLLRGTLLHIKLLFEVLLEVAAELVRAHPVHLLGRFRETLRAWLNAVFVADLARQGLQRLHLHVF